MKLTKRIFSSLICGALSLSVVAFVPCMSSLSTSAAEFSQINDSSVFVKQQTSDSCTLAANVMMLRRTALMRGDSDWESITESACRSSLWYDGVGVYHNYKYKNITVSYQYILRSKSVTEQLKSALAEHPEGIVVYDYDYPHAILLTDYTDGEFYCSDSARNVASGRIKASQSLINIENIEAYWYVSSPDVSLETSSNNNVTSNNSSNNTVNSNQTETWKISSLSGVNIRSGAGTSYSISGAVPYNTTVTVTNKKFSGDYIWGYVTYNGRKGWIALDYATCINANNSSNVSSGVLENWKISSSNGVNVRSGAGTSYNVIGALSNNTKITVTDKKTSGGYTWGYTTYNSINGWVALDYAVSE